MITKKEFSIVWEWDRGRLQGQENRGYYKVVVNKTGEALPKKFTSKKSADEWLGKTIKLANMIKQGKIKV